MQSSDTKQTFKWLSSNCYYGGNTENSMCYLQEERQNYKIESCSFSEILTRLKKNILPIKCPELLLLHFKAYLPLDKNCYRLKTCSSPHSKLKSGS